MKNENYQRGRRRNTGVERRDGAHCTSLNPPEIDLQIHSSVDKQFGEAIRYSVLALLEQYRVSGVQLIIDDKGALIAFAGTVGNRAAQGK